MVEILVSFWDGLFSGAVLVLGPGKSDFERTKVDLLCIFDENIQKSMGNFSGVPDHRKIGHPKKTSIPTIHFQVLC